MYNIINRCKEEEQNQSITYENIRVECNVSGDVWRVLDQQQQKGGCD